MIVWDQKFGVDSLEGFWYANEFQALKSEPQFK